MQGYIFELITNLVEGIIETRFFIRYLGYKKDRTAKITCILMIVLHFITVCICNRLTYLSNYTEWIIAGTWLIMLMLFLRGSFWEKFFLTGIHHVLLSTISIILFAMFDHWITFDSRGYMTFGVVRIMLVIIAKSAELLLLEIILCFRSKEPERLSNKVFGWLSCIVFMTIVAHSYLRDIIYQEALANNLTNEARLVSIALFIIDIIVYIMCMGLVNNSAELFRERMKNLAFENKIADIEHIKEMHMQTMKIRHDMKNELLNIRLLLKDGRDNDAERYLDEILNIKLSRSNIIFTDNYLVDAIINRTIDKCKDIGITIETFIECQLKEINEMDIAILLSNLLDNAVEAAQKSEEKHIYLKISRVKKYLYIYVKNTFDKEVLTGTSGLQTTKENKLYHGYGLLNVKDIVTKYAGEYETKYEGVVFETFVTLYLDKMTA